MSNILQIVASKGWGGGEKYLLELSQKLTLQGHNIHIISPRKNSALERFTPIATTISTNLKGIPSIFKLRRIIREQQIDIIHTHIFRHAILACAAAKISPRPVSVVMTRHLIKKAKNSLIYRWLYRSIDHIIFVSEIARREFETSLKPGITHPSMSVVYNAITPTPPPAKTCDNNTPAIGYIGRLSPEKGVDTLIEAFARLTNKQARLVIVGTGPAKYVECLKAMSCELGIAERVDFTGFCTDTSIPMSSFQIGVVPSKWREPFGLVLLEYMSAGIPVISTNNGAQSEIIISSNQGILIEPNHPVALAEAIDKLIGDPELRRQLATAGRQRALDFNYENFVGQIEHIYTQQQAKKAENITQSATN